MKLSSDPNKSTGSMWSCNQDEYIMHSIVLQSSILQEWVALLREMALHFTTIPALNEYQCLLNSDLEVDFFNNVVHLQVSLRYLYPSCKCEVSPGLMFNTFIVRTFQCLNSSNHLVRWQVGCFQLDWLLGCMDFHACSHLAIQFN
jgi:hypothetical protein